MSLNFPETFTAGDTLELTYSHADYDPGDGWSASIVLNGPSKVEVEGEEDPDNPDGFIFTAASSATADWVVGHYGWFVIVTSDDSPAERATLCSGATEILADPLSQDEPRETRSFAELQLEKIETLLASQGNQLSYSLFGRSYTYESRTALLEARRMLRQEIEAERERERRRHGGRSRNVAFLNFGRGSRWSGPGGSNG